MQDRLNAQEQDNRCPDDLHGEKDRREGQDEGPQPEGNSENLHRYTGCVPEDREDGRLLPPGQGSTHRIEHTRARDSDDDGGDDREGKNV